MSADLNDQFVTRCHECGTVMTVRDAIRQEVTTGSTSHTSISGRTTISSTSRIVDLCRLCSRKRQADRDAWIEAAPKVFILLISILGGLAVLFFGGIFLLIFLAKS